jgi:hypothetical protein
MSTGTKIFTVVAAVILVGALLGGCEDTNVTVPTDSVIELSANPGTVRIDPNNDTQNPDTLRFEKTSVITAFVFDTDNRPSQGVTRSRTSTAERRRRLPSRTSTVRRSRSRHAPASSRATSRSWWTSSGGISSRERRPRSSRSWRARSARS